MKRSIDLQVCIGVQRLKQNWKMRSTFARLILLVLHTAQSWETTKTPQKLDEIVASPGDNIQVRCRLPPGSHRWAGGTWYKERRDRSLQRIYRSYGNSKPEGKYSDWGSNLVISNVQRNDSGVYYCASSVSWNVRLIHGTRMIVTDTPRPSRSVLVPFPLEGFRPNHSVPLLCLTLDADPYWHNYSWDISEESSRDQEGVGVMDEDGVFSIWHLEMVPWKEWSEEKAYSCLLRENGTSGAVTSTDTGTCIYSLYIGIPSIVILLVPLLILLFRKHRARGNSERGANRIPRRETPQTDYAEVHYKNTDVLCVD